MKKYLSTETEIKDIVRFLGKKEGFEIAERLAKVVLKLYEELDSIKKELSTDNTKEVNELKSKVEHLERQVRNLESRTFNRTFSKGSIK